MLEAMSSSSDRSFAANLSAIVVFGFMFFADCLLIPLFVWLIAPHNEDVAMYVAFALLALPFVLAVMAPFIKTLRIQESGILVHGRLIPWGDIKEVQSIELYRLPRDDNRFVILLSSGEEVVVQLWYTRWASGKIFSFLGNAYPEVSIGENLSYILTTDQLERRKTITQIGFVVFALCMLGLVYSLSP